MQGKTKLEKNDTKDKLHSERQLLWAKQRASDLYSYVGKNQIRLQIYCKIREMKWPDISAVLNFMLWMCKTPVLCCQNDMSQSAGVSAGYGSI